MFHQPMRFQGIANMALTYPSEVKKADEAIELSKNTVNRGLATDDITFEDMDVISNMELNPDGAVGDSLLGAHTLLSNLYAANGKRDDVAGISASLKTKDQRKS
uniref:Uncharacterized protein n=1 Tax=Tanacetum cinerariifolium TaxID=118510 RepID=A0A6L2KN50_TANCI|nr:hypothetical protein [Tanacetum cinerariifolium]